MEDPILWTDWLTWRITNHKQYANLLMSFMKIRFEGKEVEVNSEYQGTGMYRLKYWYNRPDGEPPLIRLEWEAPVC